MARAPMARARAARAPRARTRRARTGSDLHVCPLDFGARFPLYETAEQEIYGVSGERVLHHGGRSVEMGISATSGESVGLQ
eukprot:15433408-Alexandrium_andersonii.AAC.1